MNLTNAQRVQKLVGNLAASPELISPYVRHNLLTKKLPIDLKLPWWSYKAIAYVDGIVAGKKIFEYGTGGSTLRFAAKAASVFCVEDDEKWAAIVLNRLRKENIHNVQVEFTPFDFYHPDGFETSRYLTAVTDDNFDIVIIDGQDHSFRERIKCFQFVEPRMQSGQTIVVDDFWRYGELMEKNKAREVKVFESVGPSRIGVTTTAVFHY